MYYRIYYSFIWIDDPEVLVDLEISIVDSIGDTLGGKIGYDHFEVAKFIDINDERELYRFILSLRRMFLIEFIKNPQDFDSEFKGFTPETSKIIDNLFNEYVLEKYPELFI